MSGMFKALGNLTGGRNNTKENLSPKPRSGSHTQLPTNISRLVGLVRDGKIQTAMEELAKATTVVDSITTLCLMAEPNNRSTLLHAAAEVGSEEVAKAVIAYTGPANSLSPLVNAQDKQGFTPFHVAASAHQYAICDLLLEKGGNPNAQNQEKTTPLHYLIRHQMNGELKALLEKCIAKGGDLEARNKYGESALHQACSRLNESGIVWLLEHKVSLKTTNEFGETALHKVARFIGQDPRAVGVMQMLVKAGADPAVAGAHGTALDLIAESNRHLVAEFMPVGTALQESHSGHSAESRPHLRHADSSDKLKGLMAMLQKKRTMRQINQGEASTTDLEASQVAPAPAPIAATASGSNESLLPETTSSAVTQLNIPPAYAAAPELPTAEPAVAVVVPAAAAGSGLSLSTPESPKRTGSPPPTLQESQISQISQSSLLELSLTLSARRLSSKVISPAAGYRVELGRGDIGWPTTEVHVEVVVDYYRKFFYDAERAAWHRHWNFIGFMDLDRTDPVIISVADCLDGKMHRVIIRTAAGSHQIFIPHSKIPQGAKHIEREIQKAIEADVFTSCQLWPVESPMLKDELLEYEMHEPERIAALPVGVIYAREGQVTPTEFWNNKEGSAAFNEFLEILGDKVALQGWSGYAGGLDVVKNSRGTHSVYTHWREFDIMFHVSTLLPFDDWDAAKVQRSRVIGNDVVNIIFQEGDTPFPANALPGAVTYVFIVVRPELNEDGQLGFRLGAVWREGVCAFKPELSAKLLNRDQLREILLTKVLNGHLASQKGPGLAKMYSRPRKALLEELSESHIPDIRKLAKSKKSGKGK